MNAELLEACAGYLENYAEFLRTESPINLERHPYVPEMELAAEELRALSTQTMDSTPLTDERIDKIIKDCPHEDFQKEGWIVRQRRVWARAIEAAHGIQAAPINAGDGKPD